MRNEHETPETETMTDVTPEQKKEIDERWANDKPLYDYSGPCCAGCLPNGEPGDEKPELHADGTQVSGLCYNCADTAFEIHPEYARLAIYGERK